MTLYAVWKSITITITGADTVSAGSSAQYSASISPQNAGEKVKWSIVSGEGLAKIDANGLLTAGNTPGTVTIRATATEDSTVYAEKTVTIQSAEPEPNPDEPQIVVSSAKAFPGKTVKIDISLKNNPGLVGAILSISYGDGLTLQSVTDSGLLANSAHGPLPAGNPYTVSWDDSVRSDNITADGVLTTLEFLVAEDAQPGEITVSVSYSEGNIYNADLDDVKFRVCDGHVNVVLYTPGDINGDGTINGKDVAVLRRYLAGWDVEVNELAADVNGDGIVNGKDVALIRRYLAGWDVELK